MVGISGRPIELNLGKTLGQSQYIWYIRSWLQNSKWNQGEIGFRWSHCADSLKCWEDKQ